MRSAFDTAVASRPRSKGRSRGRSCSSRHRRATGSGAGWPTGVCTACTCGVYAIGATGAVAARRLHGRPCSRAAPAPMLSHRAVGELMRVLPARGGASRGHGADGRRARDARASRCTASPSAAPARHGGLRGRSGSQPVRADAARPRAAAVALRRADARLPRGLDPPRRRRRRRSFACIDRNPRKHGADRAAPRARRGRHPERSRRTPSSTLLRDGIGLPIPRTNIDRRGRQGRLLLAAARAHRSSCISYRFHGSRRAFEADVARRRRSTPRGVHLRRRRASAARNSARARAARSCRRRMQRMSARRSRTGQAPRLRPSSSSSARTHRTPAATVAEKSRSGSASMRIATPSPSEKMTSTTASGAARSAQDALGLLRAQQLGEPLALAAQQLGELDRDLVVAAREREQLEDQRDEAGSLRTRSSSDATSPATTSSAERAPASCASSSPRRTSQSRRTTSTSSCSFVPK